MTSTCPSIKPAIAVHGGAWAIPEYLAEASVNGVKRAAQCGYSILSGGGTALDAVTSAIKILEDDPAFDAGTGSVLTVDGKIEMDAIVMDGKTLDFGAVGCVQNVKYPSQLARLVMEKTPHVLLSGPGANKFGWEHGVEFVPTESLMTEEARKEHEEYKKYKTAVNSLFNARGHAGEPGHETVGIVAVDSQGNVACTTSTGGISSKLAGRIGDTPVVGSGGYCCNEVGAVSTTGYGEAIMRVCLARRVIWHMKQGCSAQEATEKALSYMAERVHGFGGCVVVDKRGNIGRHFTTERMAWAAIDGQGVLTNGLNPQEGYKPLYSGNQAVTLPKELALPCTQPIIMVHGGAGYGNFTEDFIKAHYNGVKAAVKLGMDLLKNGGTSLDAVTKAVEFFENDPFFNAGIGSKLYSDGSMGMDALIMDGKTLKAGAVTGISHYVHPIQIARKVMEKTDHVFLSDEGANSFAASQGFEAVTQDVLVTKRVKEQFERLKKNPRKGKRQNIEHDTVGAIAIDCHGNMATACSTGGISGDMPGRVGDSPLIGGGSYCDNEIGAVTVTGHGESMAKVCLSKHVMELMEEGESPQSACDKALKYMEERLKLQDVLHDYGAGMIVLGRNGDVGFGENSGKLSYAYIKGNEMHYGMERSEHLVELLN